MVTVFVTGGVKVNTTITEEDSMKKILRWIGFTKEDHWDSIYDDSVNSFRNIRMLIKNAFTVYHLTFTEGLRLMGRYTLGCTELKR